MNAAEPPSEVTPTSVLAADPPEISTAGPMASYRSSARAVSMSSIAPAVRSWAVRNSWLSWLRTSTRALPMATTSSRPLTRRRSRGALDAAEGDRDRRRRGRDPVRLDRFGRWAEPTALGLDAAVQRGALLERPAERLDDGAQLR